MSRARSNPSRLVSWPLAISLSLALGAASCADDETSATTQNQGGTGAIGGAGGMGGAVTGSGGAAECDSDDACPGLAKACRYPVCLEGTCTFENAPSGALCDEGNDRRVCDGEGTCVKDLGASCLVAHECHSNFCTDGVCCDAVCSSGCQACNLGGSEGTCTAHAGDTDPEGACSGGAGVCDGGNACTHGGHRLSIMLGDPSDQRGLAIDSDPGGATFVGGEFAGTFDPSGFNPIVSAGGHDAFVMKIGTDGGVLWSDVIGDAGEQAVRGVATNGGSDVVYVGAFEGSVMLGASAHTSGGGTDIFVIARDTNGTPLWDAAFGGSSNETPTAVRFDSLGHVLIAGEMRGSVSFDGGATTLTSAGGTDVFVVELDQAGNHVWSRAFGGTGDDHLGGLATDGEAVLVTGDFEGEIDFGGGALTSAGNADVFVARLDTDGGHVWSNAFGDVGVDVSLGADCDALGNVVIGGSFEGAVDFGGGVRSANGARDAFVARYDPSGSHIASDDYGNNGEQQFTGVASDASGAVVLTGNFTGNIGFGGGSLGLSGATPDGFVVKLSPDLTFLWDRRLDAIEHHPEAISTGWDGAPVITGSSGGSCNFGGGTRPHAGGADVFAAKYRR